MVDPLSSVSGRLRTSPVSADTARPGFGPAQSTPARIGDSVELGQGKAARGLPPGLGSPEPPIDLPLVKQIKEAIAEGRYPVDRDKLADRLFESYRELTL